MAACCGAASVPSGFPVAVAPIESFDRVQGKLAFAALLDELGLRQPRWWPADQRPADAAFPFWVKASHGTAGRSVRRVSDEAQEQRAIVELDRDGSGAVMGQAEAVGIYGQVQALFDTGRIVAAHTSVQLGVGAGGSAAARLGVEHGGAVAAAERIGEHLAWHGGLTLDYLYRDGQPSFIECNPRTVEPGNAALSGVDLPALTVALTRGDRLPGRPVRGRAGVRTRSAIGLIIGAAEQHGTRRAVLSTAGRLLLRRGETGRAIEVLTPIGRDPGTALALAYVTARLAIVPAHAAALARSAVDRYAVTPEAVAVARAAVHL